MFENHLTYSACTLDSKWHHVRFINNPSIENPSLFLHYFEEEPAKRCLLNQFLKILLHLCIVSKTHSIFKGHSEHSSLLTLKDHLFFYSLPLKLLYESLLYFVRNYLSVEKIQINLGNFNSLCQPTSFF